MIKILLSNKYDEQILEFVRNVVPDKFNLVAIDYDNREMFKNEIVDAEYLIVSGRQKIDKDILKHARTLKMIQRTGVGVDMLNLEDIKERGIPVYVNKGVNSQSVAEHTILLMLSALRKLPQIDAELKSGIWKKQSNGIKTRELYGKTVGLVGMGNIGEKVAKILTAFGTKTLYYDVRKITNEREQFLNVEYNGLEEIIKKSDIISLHCALNDNTKHIVDYEFLSKMKHNSILINTARGGLVDESALIEALNNNVIGFAALDVFENEPVLTNSDILKMNNIIVTPHIGGVTLESFQEMWQLAIHNIEQFHEKNYKEIEDKRII